MLSKAIAILRKINRRLYPPEWPYPPYFPLQKEPQFVFIFTPPYSGSTALAKVLNSAPASMALTADCEGQWLVPGLCKADRWDPKMPVDWESVRLTWLSRVRMVNDLTGKANIVIEKSPPNLVRHKQLLETFTNHEIIVFNRNPFANCASILYRNYCTESMSENDRLATMESLARHWVARSNYSKAIINSQGPLVFTYEQFCAAPAGIADAVVNKIPGLQGINPEVKICVKDYAPQQITNLNTIQISKLTSREIQAIGTILKDHETLLNEFQYTSDWTQDVKDGGAKTTSAARI
jgi:hypothetical protein